MYQVNSISGLVLNVKIHLKSLIAQLFKFAYLKVSLLGHNELCSHDFMLLK